ncbi:MAG TPA: hypothetical protein VK578_03190 [Edaphobacter sp.]|nr:hypothetical protein [Edaphobacter sp.]
MIGVRRIAILLGAVATTILVRAGDPVVVATYFEVGNDTGDRPGEV